MTGMEKMGFVNWLRDRLTHPTLRGLDIDDPRTTELRRSVITQNGFLRQVYACWYAMLLGDIPLRESRILELGSGGGFLRDVYPGVITSDLILCRHVAAILDARALPFGTGELSAIVMTNVLHHVPHVRDMFAEAARCVRPGGTLAMVEPWVTPWSTFVYERLHHEPFDPSAATWDFPSTGPLSAANGALPWIVFNRDRAIFDHDYPEWRVQTIRPIMPFQYLLSGGISMRALVPAWTYPLWSALEGLLERRMESFGMFAYVELRRTKR